MRLADIDLNVLIPELDACRVRQNLSYQNVADSCNLSQTTIIRIFKRSAEPSVETLQKIAAAVHFSPPQEQVVLTGYTQEAYVDYLQRAREADKEEYRIREAQQEAKHNMLRNQDRRTISILTAILLFFAVAFISWLIIDVTHPDVGWFQRDTAYRYNAEASSFVLSVWNWLKQIW